jgi:hypothetical protein
MERNHFPSLLVTQYGWKRTFLNPRLAIEHFSWKISAKVNSFWHYRIKQHDDCEKGTAVTDRDWDNLIILDACRYDKFEQYHNIDGDLSFIYSLGKYTDEFLRRNFNDETMLDTVYVTANPKVNQHFDTNTFYEIVPAWEEQWNKKYGTVLPSDLTELVLKVNEEFPHKRLIIHYVQPHEPYIGEKGHQFKLNNDLRGIGPEASNDKTKFLLGVRYGLINISDKEVHEFYDENLVEVLESVQNLVDKLDGKSVITSDHGEFLGERAFPIPYKLYGHGGLPLKSMIKIPWLVAEYDTRREIKTGEITQKDTNFSEEKVKDRLDSLGYV